MFHYGSLDPCDKVSRGLGWRIHGSVEDTKLSTNKQHTHSAASLGTPGIACVASLNALYLLTAAPGPEDDLSRTRLPIQAIYCALLGSDTVALIPEAGHLFADPLRHIHRGENKKRTDINTDIALVVTGVVE